MCQPTDTVDVGNGVYMYKRNRMTDHNNNKGGYGRIAVEQAIWYSSNIGVAKTILKGYEDNPMKYWEGLRRIGLMEDLRLDIPDAVRARIRRPDDENNPWSKTTLPWMSFGYETMIPPIYTLAFYNAIANDGRMVRPFFVKELMRWLPERGKEEHFIPMTDSIVAQVHFNWIKQYKTVPPSGGPAGERQRGAVLLSRIHAGHSTAHLFL